jgi:hypothetical protein
VYIHKYYSSGFLVLFWLFNDDCNIETKHLENPVPMSQPRLYLGTDDDDIDDSSDDNSEHSNIISIFLIIMDLPFKPFNQFYSCNKSTKIRWAGIIKG